jgi:flagellar M-ring protein FliF
MAAILVPGDQALRLRLTFAEDKPPRGGTGGNDIFDQTGALGTTEFLVNVALRRALAGELARTIASLADVRSARVHPVLPDTSPSGATRSRREPRSHCACRAAAG